MTELERVDQPIAAVVDASDPVLGFLREGEAPCWTLLFADDLWVDVAVGGAGNTTLSTDLGEPPETLGPSAMSELQLRCAACALDTSACMAPDGKRRIRQRLAPSAFDPVTLRTRLEGFAATAQAWRERSQTPPLPTATPDRPRPTATALFGMRD